VAVDHSPQDWPRESCGRGTAYPRPICRNDLAIGGGPEWESKGTLSSFYPLLYTQQPPIYPTSTRVRGAPVWQRFAINIEVSKDVSDLLESLAEEEDTTKTEMFVVPFPS